MMLPFAHCLRRPIFAIALVSCTFCNALAQNPAASPKQPAAQGKPAPAPRTAESAVMPAVKNPERHAEFLFRKTEGAIGLLFLEIQ